MIADAPLLPRARYAGLDGLRAVAVTLVVVYHLFPGWWMRGGFIGVDVFFVISGFLITSLLLREHDQTGRVALGAFWRRRARRLLPALLLVLTVCASAAWLIGGDVLVGLGRQLVGALVFGYNWTAVADGADYFGSGGGELFRNLWSLAVEEQFYLVWPPLLLALLLLPRAWMRAVAALAAATASAVWMAVIVASGSADPLTLGARVTRAYFGTDTHAFGLLLGVAVAVAWRAVVRVERAWMRRRGVRGGVSTLGICALAGLVLLATVGQSQSTATFPGALVTASALSAFVIVAGVWPGSPLGRGLDAAPLRWIGERSYGLYLWHWPVLVLLVAAWQGTSADRPFPTALGAAALVVTVLLSALSYRFLEVPVRRRGAGRVIGGLRRAFASSARRRAGSFAVTAVAVLLVAGTAAALISAPAVFSGEAVVAAGADALQTQPAPTNAGGDPDDDVVTGDEVTAIGDSVMLASAPSLIAALPGADVDAVVSRQMNAAPDILRSLADSGRLREFVVLGLGTNGSISQRTLDQVLEVIGPDRQLVLVTASAPRSWIPGVNADIAAFARTHRGVQVADWQSAIAPHLDLLAGDEVHPGDAGGRIYADTVVAALADAQRAKARFSAFSEQRAFEQELRQSQLFQAPGSSEAG
ncbi:peptidoglycan/LPS O-acetylase OafA/YrhL [Microbacterium sp. SORGH_AS428]|uniref:acyltransferase family protein n=1 Tax=Microbacterium sp. SORGH_AS_0428 TaxID=3041788 RepID=UPI002863166C|nr:acyltransferase family protein [Microbacterium sp. SORGH_AS_0428]MDR6200395.1 peptidoglycan/LPS O-acetylase OafA/YrhL [Microbacterium sp. SORGH_AS_0428]